MSTMSESLHESQTSSDSPSVVISLTDESGDQEVELDRQDLDRRTSRSSREELINASVSALTDMACAMYKSGRLAEARSRAILGLDRSVNGSGTESEIGRLHHVVSCACLEWNDISGARSHAIDAMKSFSPLDTCTEQVDAMLQMAMISAAEGQRREAMGHLDEARQVALTAPLDERAHSVLTRDHVAVLLDLGDVGQAQQWLRGIRPQPSTELEDEALMLRMLVAQGSSQGLGERAIRLLKALRGDASLRTRVEIGTSSAVALDFAGRRSEAVVILSTTVQLGQTESFTRTVARHGAHVLPLLLALSETGPQGRHVWEKAYLERLIAATEGAGRSPHDVLGEGDGSYEPLSDRELQVLRLLAGTLSNREIGAELYLSVNTVKTHVKSVYAKLGVNRRAEAVNKARGLGLLRSGNGDHLEY